MTRRNYIRQQENTCRERECERGKPYDGVYIVIKVKTGLSYDRITKQEMLKVTLRHQHPTSLSSTVMVLEMGANIIQAFQAPSTSQNVHLLPTKVIP